MQSEGSFLIFILEPSMSSNEIKRELQGFKNSIQKLSVGIGQVGTLWKDQKYNDLNSSVKEVASQSKTVMVYGDRCCSSIDRFDRIASEKY